MRKKHLRVIKMIQDGIPKELLMNLTKKEVQAPTIRKIYELALTKPDDEVSPRQKRNIQALMDTGRLDQEVEVLDHEIEKQIDEYMEAEIAKAVKLGRLPKEAPMLNSLKKKGTQYAKRQERRLRREFTGEGEDVADGTETGEKNQSTNPPRPGNEKALPSLSAAIL